MRCQERAASAPGADVYLVAPVVKAMKVLEYVAERGYEVSLTETASAVGLPKTTVFRYLQTLSAAGFLQHDIARDRYGAGARLRRVADADRAFGRLRTCALPLMHEISCLFSETINLAFAADGCVVYLEITEPARAPRFGARVGMRHPLHSTALGKAILANVGDAERDLVLGASLDARTWRTVTRRGTLLHQLCTTRARGYAVEIGETEDDAGCVGVPVLDASGQATAALSLSAPQRRLSEALVGEAAASLRAAARAIAQSLQ